MCEQSHPLLGETAHTSSLPCLTLTGFFSFAACQWVSTSTATFYSCGIELAIWETERSTALKVIYNRWENPDFTAFVTKHMKTRESKTENPSSSSGSKQLTSPPWCSLILSSVGTASSKQGRSRAMRFSYLLFKYLGCSELLHHGAEAILFIICRVHIIWPAWLKGLLVTGAIRPSGPLTQVNPYQLSWWKEKGRRRKKEVKLDVI